MTVEQITARARTLASPRPALTLETSMNSGAPGEIVLRKPLKPKTKNCRYAIVQNGATV
jgi:hypothetical protein